MTRPRSLRLGATEHPTLIVEVDGDERVSSLGFHDEPQSSASAVAGALPRRPGRVGHLRQQLGSPTEEFPTGPLRGRVRQAEKLELIREVPLFKALSKRHLTQLARLADEIHRDDGDVLIEEGQSGDEFFIVARGAVKVVKRGRKVASLMAGECFGEMSLFDDKPRSATVVATIETTLLTIHRADFDRYLMRSPAIMRTFLGTMSERLR